MEPNQPVSEQPTGSFQKKIIATRLGALVIALAAVIGGSLVWWSGVSYGVPEVTSVGAKNLILKKELPEGYQIKNGSVFLYEIIIQGADPATFQWVDGPYTKDKTNVYVGRKSIEGADPVTFRYLGHFHFNDYAKDKSYVYFNNIVFGKADPATFQYIGGEYFKDKNNVYDYGIVENADVATFQYLGGLYAKDKDNVFLGNKIIRNVDLSTFQYIGGLKEEGYRSPVNGSIGNGYAKDKDHIYYDFNGSNYILQNVDLTSFEYVGGPYAKDKKQVYCHGSGFIVPYYNYDAQEETVDIDIATFEYIGGEIDFGVTYAKDKNHVYFSDDSCRNDIVKSSDIVDPKTFRYLGGVYTKDKNHVYYYGGDMKNVDIATFEYVGGPYAKDKIYVYNRGSIAPKLDSKTLEYVEFYIKDKDYVYSSGGELMQGAIPANCTKENLGGCKGTAQ